MKAVRRWFTRLFNFTTSRRDDERLREEIQSHITFETEAHIRAGMTPEEAHRQARLKFGTVDAVREDYHAEEGLPFLEDLVVDIRYAVRVLRKTPAFTAVVILTLMLGIGANVVVFGVLNAVLLRPLEVSDPRNLYQLRNKAWMRDRLLTTSYPAFEDFRRRNTTFSDMAAINAYSDAGLRWRNQAVRQVQGQEVTGNYFDLLGVQPAIGRFFQATDEHGPNSAPYVVLSDKLWRQAFAADRGVVGTTVELNRHPFTVVGVAPERFHGTERFVWPDYWIPMLNEQQVAGWDYLHSRTSTATTVIGRLKPEVTPQQATENLSAISTELALAYPKSDQGLPIRLIQPGLFGDDGDLIRGFLYSITVMALLVLAAACANLASLFAGRASDRSRELALRVALGSSRRRLMKQLLTEAVVVSLIGGAAGLISANLLLGVLNRWRPSFGHLEVSMDARVYLAGLALTLGSALLFGMVPAWRALRSSPLEVIKRGSVDSVTLRRFALRDLLLGVQIAICTVLVAASLVAARGMVRALKAPLGIQPQGVMLAEMHLDQAGRQGALMLQKETEMIEALRRIPGVTAVGAVNATPMGGGSKGIPIYRSGTTEFTPGNSVLTTRQYNMSPGYLEAAGTRLLGGRNISWQDTAKNPHVAIVNETFARMIWGGTAAIGQYFILRGNLTEVVGVAEDGKYHDLTESPQAAVYLPVSQSGNSNVVFVVRSQLGPSEIAGAMQRTLNALEPDVPIALQSWPDALSGVLFPARAATGALGVTGLLAAMLAVTGIFGMAAYNVSRRMKELGIRVALGASKAQLMRAAVSRPMLLLGVGSMLGLLAGIFATRLLTQIVYQANPGDPVVVAGTAVTMAILGLAAAAVPVRRALAVDAAKLMREE